ncbi:FAD binding domain-containing protein [Haloferax sp. DFSO52]|uniref:FAD binding domain-containing protein n=1 Tax=Haloferax sp. DFSO52 TaxID=3388505 RepID=UPI003A8BB589
MKRFEMAFPESVSEACQILADNPGSRPIAGGTALSIVMKEGIYAPERLVNIRGLKSELDYVTLDDDVVRIGALTPMVDIERAEPIVEHLPTISQCLGNIAGVRVRNTATIGGHLAHADLHLDLPPVLAGLDAEVCLSTGSDERRLPVDEFIRGYYDTALEPAELITEITIPVPEENTRGVYLKHRYFSEVDWPCVGVAAFAVEADGAFSDVRVLLNSVGKSSIMAVEGIDDVIDSSLSDEAIEAVAELAREQSSPSSDIRGSAAYKERMAGEFTGRALRAIRDEEAN